MCVARVNWSTLQYGNNNNDDDNHNDKTKIKKKMLTDCSLKDDRDMHLQVCALKIPTHSVKSCFGG